MGLLSPYSSSSSLTLVLNLKSFSDNHGSTSIVNLSSGSHKEVGYFAFHNSWWFLAKLAVFLVGGFVKNLLKQSKLWQVEILVV